MPFEKLPKTNLRTDILPNSVAVFIMILHYKSVTKYRHTRHTFTKLNGLYARLWNRSAGLNNMSGGVKTQ